MLNQLGDFGHALDILLEGDHYASAAIFVGMAGAAPALREGWLETLAKAAAKRPGKWLGLSILARPEIAARYEDAGFAVFEDTSRMLTAQAALVRIAAGFDREHSAQGPATPRESRAWPPGTASEVDAKQLLRELGITGPVEVVCSGPEEAARVARELNVAVALKVVSPDIQHKTEVGGVALGLRGDEQVRAAVEAMDARVRAACPAAQIRGYLVSTMAPDGTDVMIGLRQDPAFGAFVLFGAGGILAELLGDVAIRLAPVTVPEARAMIAETRISKLLAGWRGAPAADVEALARAISTMSACAEYSGERHDIEVNPLRVLPEGRGVLALDALIARSA
ncbi:acetate--CoA ligase family protein [Ramlibacter terrae]|uniref:Acetate--CoA ligase family protein n=1 Tax=Ramlibacter terrae TaxID=2732511 RepID=A0ABX6P626_9BURK|nr:acetate--CoA ligase family protein [Ramlibacter terrae]